MSYIDPISQKKKAQDFCREHLFECCSGVRLWHKTGLLPSGRINELAAIFTTFITSDDVLMHVEDEVKRQAMDYVLGNPPSTAEPDDYKKWYEEAMGATNEAGYAGMDAASVIREMDKTIDQLNRAIDARGVPAAWREKVDLAAQMLTWGDSEGGLTESQVEEMKTVQAELFKMLEQKRIEPTTELEQVHGFLLGQLPLDGLYFGDSDSDRPRERYWWRRYLQEAISCNNKEKKNA